MHLFLLSSLLATEQKRGRRERWSNSRRSPPRLGKKNHRQVRGGEREGSSLVLSWQYDGSGRMEVKGSRGGGGGGGGASGGSPSE